jgi:hypothetical protein
MMVSTAIRRGFVLLAVLLVFTSSCDALVQNGSCSVGEEGGSCSPSPIKRAGVEIFSNPLTDAEASLLGRLESEVVKASFAVPSSDPLLAPSRAVASGSRGEYDHYSRGTFNSAAPSWSSGSSGFHMESNKVSGGGVAAAAALSPESILFSGGTSGASNDLGLF